MHPLKTSARLLPPRHPATQRISRGSSVSRSAESKAPGKTRFYLPKLEPKGWRVARSAQAAASRPRSSPIKEPLLISARCDFRRKSFFKSCTRRSTARSRPRRPVERRRRRRTEAPCRGEAAAPEQLRPLLGRTRRRRLVARFPPAAQPPSVGAQWPLCCCCCCLCCSSVCMSPHLLLPLLLTVLPLTIPASKPQDVNPFAGASRSRAKDGALSQHKSHPDHNNNNSNNNNNDNDNKQYPQ